MQSPHLSVRAIGRGLLAFDIQRKLSERTTRLLLSGWSREFMYGLGLWMCLLTQRRQHSPRPVRALRPEVALLVQVAGARGDITTPSLR